MPRTWWLRKPSYLVFMLRELSSIFLGGYAVVWLVLLYKLGQGPEAYQEFQAGLKSWPSIGFHVVALAFALLHTITWFNAAPQSMALRLGERRVAPGIIAALHYGGWIIVSAAVFWLLSVLAAP